MTRRSLAVCSEPGCPELTRNTYCEQHAPKPWASSTRKDRVISGGAQQKRAARIMRQHHAICHVCGQPGAEVDHIIPLAEGGADGESNLAPICIGCHVQKTAAESARGRRSA